MTLPLFTTAAAGADDTDPGEETGGDRPDGRSNALGGGDGYSAVVSPDEATVVVSTGRELASALADAGSGDVVYVAGGAEIDVGSAELTVPAGVTLASDRGIDGSAGGLVRTPTTEQWPGVLTLEADGRITGLRLAGPVTECCDYVTPVTSGVVVVGPGCEIDNVVVWGFNHAAVRLQESAHVHHAFVHSNPMDGLGYGVLCTGGDSTVIEHTRFDYNRHGVATDGGAGYTVRYNHFGPDAVGCQVDAHRPGGTSLEIHHNTFEATRYHGSDEGPRPSVTVRGTPTDVADVHHNWFHNPLEPLECPDMWTDEAIAQIYVEEWSNVRFEQNAYGASEPPAAIGCPRVA